MVVGCLKWVLGTKQPVPLTSEHHRSSLALMSLALESPTGDFALRCKHGCVHCHSLPFRTSTVGSNTPETDPGPMTTVCAWTRSLTSLHPHFLICTIGVMEEPLPQGH